VRSGWRHRARPTLLLAVSACVGSGAVAGEAPTLWSAAEVRWGDLPGVPGARQALLWGDPERSDHGTLDRWPAGASIPARVAPHDIHIVVFTGTLTIEIDGEEAGQFGPGSFVRIPEGARYAPGCEAAGECNFVKHVPGPETAAGD